MSKVPNQHMRKINRQSKTIKLDCYQPQSHGAGRLIKPQRECIEVTFPPKITP